MSTYLADLDDTVPLNTAKLNTIIGELQTIKSAFLDTFPNVSLPLNTSEDLLNYMDGVTSNVQTQIDAIQTDIDALTNLSNLYLISGTAPSGGPDPTIRGPQGWTRSYSAGFWTYEFPSSISSGRTTSDYFSIQLMTGDTATGLTTPFVSSRDRFGFVISAGQVGEPAFIDAWWGLVRVNPA